MNLMIISLLSYYHYILLSTTTWFKIKKFLVSGRWVFTFHLVPPLTCCLVISTLLPPILEVDHGEFLSVRYFFGSSMACEWAEALMGKATAMAYLSRWTVCDLDKARHLIVQLTVCWILQKLCNGEEALVTLVSPFALEDVEMIAHEMEKKNNLGI